MIRGEVSISRPIKPTVNRIGISGFYDYDADKNVVVFDDGKTRREFKVRSISELLSKADEARRG